MQEKKDILSKEFVREFTFNMIYKEFFDKFLFDNEKFLNRFNHEAIHTLVGVNDVLIKNLNDKDTVEKIKEVMDASFLRN